MSEEETNLHGSDYKNVKPSVQCTKAKKG